MKRSFFITLALYIGLFALVMQLHVPSFKAPQRAINISNISIKKKVCRCKKCSCKKIPLPPKEAKKKVVPKKVEKKPPKRVLPKKVKKIKKYKKKIIKKHYKPKKKTLKPKKVAPIKKAPPIAPIQKALPKSSPASPPSPLQTKEKKVAQKSYAQIYKENYFDRIRSAIQKYRRYPRIARRTKKEGVVRIAFRLSTSGKIEELRIVQSSGFKVLDRSAIKTIQKASKEFPKPKKVVKIVVPIEYKLRYN